MLLESLAGPGPRQDVKKTALVLARFSNRRRAKCSVRAGTRRSQSAFTRCDERDDGEKEEDATDRLSRFVASKKG